MGETYVRQRSYTKKDGTYVRAILRKRPKPKKDWSWWAKGEGIEPPKRKIK